MTYTVSDLIPPTISLYSSNDALKTVDAPMVTAFFANMSDSSEAWQHKVLQDKELLGKVNLSYLTTWSLLTNLCTQPGQSTPYRNISKCFT